MVSKIIQKCLINSQFMFVDSLIFALKRYRKKQVLYFFVKQTFTIFTLLKSIAK